MNKRKKKLCVIGHFAFDQQMYDGQTVKTRIITKELEKSFGNTEIEKIDTYGGKKVVFKVVGNLFNATKHCQNIIIFPAQNGLKIIGPLCKVFSKLFKNNVHYVVIGGWLPEFLKSNKWLISIIADYQGLYVESNKMKEVLNQEGLFNVYIMPNCKELPKLKESELTFFYNPPFKFCTFSRVMKEKGIEDAVEAVKIINEKNDKELCSLDIFGQVDSNQGKWFDDLRKGFPKYIDYKGIVPFDKSTEVLKDYFALLFPTYYDGEGFAGTLIDAFAAGVPTIASDWKYNSEIVNDNVTGKVIPAKDVNALVKAMEEAIANPDEWNEMKYKSLENAKNFLPENVISILKSNLK